MYTNKIDGNSIGNKNSKKIFISGKILSLNQVKNGEFLDLDLSPYYLQSLSFIKDFLNGRQEFTIQTSGSTGVPKVIKVCKDQLVASAEGTIKALNLQPSYHALICINTNYIGGIMMIVRSLLLGMEITIVEPSSDPLFSLHPSNNFDFTALVPLQLQEIINHLPNNYDVFNHFKCIIIGGAALSRKMLEDVAKLSVPIYATYGMTETLSHIALQKLNGSNREDHFTAFSNVFLKLDERGCLAIKSPVTNNEYIYTNDTVELFEERKFRYLGRYDNVINSGGIKIFPEKIEKEIEQVLFGCNLSNKFFVFGTPDERLGQKVTAFIEGDPLSSSIEHAIVTAVNDNLGEFFRPRNFVYLTKFFETPSGKIDKLSTSKLSH